MSTWLCIPSKRPHEEAESVLKLWRERGYKIALWRDDDAYGTEWTPESNIDALISDQYPGYARAVNQLIRIATLSDPDVQWFVTGGDDVEPDANHSAEEIAKQCCDHFACKLPSEVNCLSAGYEPTFGVMQPTGDRWGDHRGNTHEFEPWPEKPQRCIHCGQAEDTPPHLHGAYIDRVCGSPWMGREFCLRINQGRGPLWPEYFHMGSDEELQAVAKKYGVLWQRPDLIHLHRHWGRAEPGKPLPSADSMPEFLKEANSDARWTEYKQLYAARKAAGFPGSEPL